MNKPKHTLQSSPTSPFGRKVAIAIYHLGLTERIEIDWINTGDSEDRKRILNPLGKVPVLIVDDEEVITDSRTILAYLDDLAGGNKLIPLGDEGWSALTLMALADGILDAGLLLLYEKRFRKEPLRSTEWVQHQKTKIESVLTHCEKCVADKTDIGPSVGEIALACALGYLDFRFEGTWRKSHPKLVPWLDRFASAVPAYGDTAPEN